jgi:hypothetical protein
VTQQLERRSIAKEQGFIGGNGVHNAAFKRPAGIGSCSEQ